MPFYSFLYMYQIIGLNFLIEAVIHTDCRAKARAIEGMIKKSDRPLVCVMDLIHYIESKNI